MEISRLSAPLLNIWLIAPMQGQSPWAGLVPILLLLPIFYFLLIAPVRRRQREHDAMIAALKHGDKVVTSGGIYGTVVGIQEDRIRLKIAEQVKIEVTKPSVSSLAKPPNQD